MDNLGMDTMTIDGRTVERTYYGANGNASVLAMMLELARMLQTNSQLLGSRSCTWRSVPRARPSPVRGTS